MVGRIKERFSYHKRRRLSGLIREIGNQLLLPDPQMTPTYAALYRSTISGKYQDRYRQLPFSLVNKRTR